MRNDHLSKQPDRGSILLVRISKMPDRFSNGIDHISKSLDQFSQHQFDHGSWILDRMFDVFALKP